MIQEPKSRKGKEDTYRDGSRPMLLPLEDISKKRRSETANRYSKQKPLKHDELYALNILAEAAGLCMRKKDQSFVNEVHLESELVQIDNACEQKNSMVNSLSSSYGSCSPLDILTEAVETFQLEENQHRASLRKGFPFVPIPKKRRSSVQKPSVEPVQTMDLQCKKVTHKRCCNSGEREKFQQSKKRRSMILAKPESENPTADLPDEFKNHIREVEGSDVKFLMQKSLYDTDVNTNNNRLSMPQRQICCEFLSEDEKTILNEREGGRGRPCGIQVMILDPCLREFSLTLKKWGMGSVSIYNLVKNWKNVVIQNNLNRGDCVQLWSFRANGNLCLLLNCRK